MNQETKIRLLDRLIILGIVLILLVGFIMGLYFFYYQENKCLANPLSYGVKELEKTYSVEAIGSVHFMNHPEIIISFDNRNFSISNINNNKKIDYSALKRAE